jgi:hypothetical protein
MILLMLPIVASAHDLADPNGDGVENTKNKNTTIYDLNGVRQPEPKKGVNIVNGKKVVVK